MGGDLEPKTARQPPERICDLEIRVEKGQTTGRARPAGGVAEHAIKVLGVPPAGGSDDRAALTRNSELQHTSNVAG